MKIRVCNLKSGDVFIHFGRSYKVQSVTETVNYRKMRTDDLYQPGTPETFGGKSQMFVTLGAGEGRELIASD